MEEITKVKIRFDKWIHSTEKSHLLRYKNKEMWLSKKICWDLQIAGNDLHAWAVIPAWLFKDITGNDLNEVFKNEGIIGLKCHYGVVIHQTIEHHTPDKLNIEDINHDKSLMK